MGAIAIKTATREPRTGNELPRLHLTESGGFNSMGLPNAGYRHYASLVPKLKESGKPVIAAVAGLAEGDWEAIIEAYDTAGADLIELTLSCPNLRGKGMVAYDLAATRELLTLCRARTSKPLGVKLPPYLDISQFEQMAAVLRETNIDFITAINSVGSALMIDPAQESTVLAANDGFGGITGPAIKPVGLANVKRWSTLTDLPIIGVGGVASGADAFEYLLAGASAVGVGTQLVKEGPAVFDRINQELSTVLDEHGYASAQSPVGRLKPAVTDS